MSSSLGSESNFPEALVGVTDSFNTNRKFASFTLSRKQLNEKKENLEMEEYPVPIDSQC